MAGKTHPSGFAFGADATEAVRGGHTNYNGKKSLAKNFEYLMNQDYIKFRNLKDPNSVTF